LLSNDIDPYENDLKGIILLDTNNNAVTSLNLVTATNEAFGVITVDQVRACSERCTLPH
jgi:hypothetical protein